MARDRMSPTERTEKEQNTQPQGRSGSGTLIHQGPAVKAQPLPGNKTKMGGVNRPTTGK